MNVGLVSIFTEGINFSESLVVNSTVASLEQHNWKALLLAERGSAYRCQLNAPHTQDKAAGEVSRASKGGVIFPQSLGSKQANQPACTTTTQGQGDAENSAAA